MGSLRGREVERDGGRETLEVKLEKVEITLAFIETTRLKEKMSLLTSMCPKNRHENIVGLSSGHSL